MANDIMSKTYISPTILVVPIVGCMPLLEGSIPVDGSTPISNPDDIGFAKEERSRGSMWDNGWSD